MENRPFFSIVIANYNYGSMIATAIESILHQDCDDYEIIVVDGGSSDNSVDVIKQYQKHIAWWVSEPDTGQSNAFNKGFSHANGRFFTWLNADDILLPGSLMAVKKTLLSHPTASWATANQVRFLEENKKIISAEWGPNYLPSWLQGEGRTYVCFGPTAFWSREAYGKVGPIDEAMHLAMDIDYWIRLGKAGYKQVCVKHYCWGFRMHENSKTAEYGEHEKTDQAKIKMAWEKKYYKEKNNYRPTKFWRYVGLIMRVFDGSIFKSLYDKKTLIGKNIIDYYNLDYKI